MAPRNRVRLEQYAHCCFGGETSWKSCDILQQFLEASSKGFINLGGVMLAVNIKNVWGLICTSNGDCIAGQGAVIFCSTFARNIEQTIFYTYIPGVCLVLEEY